MNVTGALKRAPRWAWITAAGVGIGAASIKLWRGRAKPDSENDTVPGQLIGPDGLPLPTGTGNPLATITPPVIIQPTQNDPMFGVSELQALYIDGVDRLIDGWEKVWGPVQSAQLSLLTDFFPNVTLTALAQAGSAPSAGGAVSSADPGPAPAPQPIPPPAPPPPPDPCVGEFPNLNEQTGQCYKVVCASGSGTHAKGRWHFYANGHKVHVRSTC